MQKQGKSQPNCFDFGAFVVFFWPVRRHRVVTESCVCVVWLPALLELGLLL